MVENRDLHSGLGAVAAEALEDSLPGRPSLGAGPRLGGEEGGAAVAQRKVYVQLESGSGRESG